MAIQSRSRRSAAALRVAALLCLSACFVSLKPLAFNVKGTWETTLSEAKAFPLGFAPDSVAGLVVSGSTSTGAEVGVELKDRLGLVYKEGPFQVRLDDSQAWQANYTTDEIDVILSGVGAEPVNWEARKSAAVEGLGDVQVNVSNAAGFGVSVARDLPTVAGVHLKGFVSAKNEAILGRLQAERGWGEAGSLKYVMENPEGDYALANLSYMAKLSDVVQDGSLNAMLKRTGSTNSYNVSYEHGLNTLLKGDAGVIVGYDNEGAYGRLSKSHSVGKGVTVAYTASGRSDVDLKAPSYLQTLRLSNDVASIALSKSKDGVAEAKVALANEIAGLALKATMNTTIEQDAEVKYNVTASKDLTAVLDKLGSTGSITIGSDAASEDGLYALLEANRELGNGFAGGVSVATRGQKVTPALTVSNRLGYAQVRKDPDSPARLRVGYEFSA
mmetsp:Transcript_56612/g.132843  ORF Transcript_56612/g.132843 Transcript_56612/m.132843 type:complete len:443 (+) Transcript_56612:70-1398(+)